MAIITLENWVDLSLCNYKKCTITIVNAREVTEFRQTSKKLGHMPMVNTTQSVKFWYF